MAEAQASQDRGPAVLAVTAAMISLSSVFVALRFISRIGFVKRITLDDYFMMAAWAISFGLSFSICYATACGLGRHEADIPLHLRATLYKLEYAFLVLYNPSLMATKSSILVFYLDAVKRAEGFQMGNNRNIGGSQCSWSGPHPSEHLSVSPCGRRI